MTAALSFHFELEEEVIPKKRKTISVYLQSTAVAWATAGLITPEEVASLLGPGYFTLIERKAVVDFTAYLKLCLPSVLGKLYRLLRARFIEELDADGYRVINVLIHSVTVSPGGGLIYTVSA